MRTVHHPTDPVRPDPRPVRCLRHHVWMAACDDCRDARTPRHQHRPDLAAPAGDAVA
ncbi:hypothetical protein [Geodermatophilus sp. CPCC 206100]|uniref:hypothetical protein n=1 Tax=Geodermatophilus sp. CPCC 206100 TaxID=3020054 RepID=UPI003AFFA18D